MEASTFQGLLRERGETVGGTPRLCVVDILGWVADKHGVQAVAVYSMEEEISVGPERVVSVRK